VIAIGNVTAPKLCFCTPKRHPGVGINLNEMAADGEPADLATLVGCYMAPKWIVDDREHTKSP